MEDEDLQRMKPIPQMFTSLSLPLGACYTVCREHWSARSSAGGVDRLEFVSSVQKNIWIIGEDPRKTLSMTWSLGAKSMITTTLAMEVSFVH